MTTAMIEPISTNCSGGMILIPNPTIKNKIDNAIKIMFQIFIISIIHQEGVLENKKPSQNFDWGSK